MLEKYRATIVGDKIEWENEAPAGLEHNARIEVEVIPVTGKPSLTKSNGKKMAEILGQIAARGGVKSIKDPSAWQREVRKDREMPGRD